MILFPRAYSNDGDPDTFNLNEKEQEVHISRQKARGLLPNSLVHLGQGLSKVMLLCFSRLSW